MALYGITDLFVAIFIVLPSINNINDSLMVFGYLLAKFFMQWRKMTFSPAHPAGKAFYAGTDAFTAWFLYSNMMELGSLASGMWMFYVLRTLINLAGINL